MLREGDIYTYNFNQKNEKRIRACYRPFIILEIKNEYVIGVPFTINVSNIVDPNCVYTTMTVNNTTKNVCILAYIQVRIPKKDLIKKIAHVEQDILNKIKIISENLDYKYQETDVGKDEIVNHMDTVFDNNNGIILETGENLKKVIHMLEGMNSKKRRWSEWVISFILGVVASIIAAMIIN